MPRKPRPTAAGYYHVASRSQRGDELFRDDADVIRLESELRSVVDTGSCVCIAACVLATHYHFLVEAAEGALSRSIGRLNQRYARAYNVRYGRRGHAFSERYLSVGIESDEQLLSAYRYVVRNPVEAGLCVSPEDWPWSSYPTLTGRGTRFGFADSTIVVELFGGLASLRQFVEG